MPKDRYTSAAFAEREWERMWTRTWLLAGRESDIPEAGDYFTFEIGRESILVIRQRDGSIQARYNVCKHRGTRLREPGRGSAGEFQLPGYGIPCRPDAGRQRAAAKGHRTAPRYGFADAALNFLPITDGIV